MREIVAASCEGVIKLEAAAGEVKSFTMAKISLLLLVLEPMQSARAARLVVRIIW